MIDGRKINGIRQRLRGISNKLEQVMSDLDNLYLDTDDKGVILVRDLYLSEVSAMIYGAGHLVSEAANRLTPQREESDDDDF